MLVELVESPLGFLKATFEFKQAHNIAMKQSRKLRITLDLNWLDTEMPLRTELSEVRRIIENSRYGLVEPTHCLDCYWHHIMAVVARCHDQARQFSKHLVTNVHIEDVLSSTQTEEDIVKLVAREMKVASYAITH